ncbi:unnamed protein product [Mytilus edulis]|uniref:Uncharacterized protein n=1 Tax=Mytilus edulis TaxID=6550 RepID=A0A8S3RLB9_MYTED|nr:unnamed protein product [Mytilus edulis]
MILSLLKKTGGDNDQPLIEYLEKWQSVTGMNSNIVKRILPEPVESVKLCHVVTLYKYLEELNGASLLESLDESFHRMLPTEATYILQKMRKSNAFALKKSDISSDYALADYINSSDLWWKEDFDKKGVVAGSDKKVVPLTEILSPFILIEHMCETVLFIQEAVKEAREFDVRILNITTDFQKKKQMQPKSSTRKNTARRILKM